MLAAAISHEVAAAFFPLAPQGNAVKEFSA
jgi:hypothetical protein